ncbi:EAL domain-containing protein [Marinobacterium arenosum]|uniref:EAL domain-containing protein n=1 Tax=Marinobacterium arenosum TaxID=2862496 RepID=UPI001C973214|nr:EAL domain-containing protein [Marinobacterium arenosum]MBY4677513.1 EAL domain-containing protein [Marinobacterium arenosum]
MAHAARKPLLNSRLALLALLLLIVLLIGVVQLIGELSNNRQQHQLHQQLSELSSRFSNSIRRNQQLLEPLNTLVQHDQAPSQQTFLQVARDLMRGHNSIRSIQLAKDAVISHVYPQAGNEQVIGIDLRQLQSARQDVALAIDSGLTTLSAPTTLLQGGTGLLMRQPIFITQPEPHFWGLATLVIDWQVLLQQSGLLDVGPDLVVALRHKHQGEWQQIHGPAEAFDDPSAQIDTLRLANTDWQLAVCRHSKPHSLDGDAILFGSLLFGVLLLASYLALISRRRSWFAPAALAGAFILFCLAVLVLRQHEYSNNLYREIVDDTETARRHIQDRLAGNQDYLRLLAEERARGRLSFDQFRSKGERYVQDHPELINLTWVSRQLIIDEVTPRQGNEQILGLSINLEQPKRAALLARETRQPVYTGLFQAIQGGSTFEIWYPVFQGEQFSGLIVGVYSAEALLQQAVPAQLHERYHLGLQTDGLSSPNSGEDRLSQQVALAPPGNGIRLQLSRPPQGLGTEQLLLVVVAIGLALGIFWSLYALQRVNRRLTERYTELSEARDALTLEKERVQVTLRSIGDGVITLDEQGNVRCLNGVAEKLIGRGNLQLKGQPLAEALPLLDEQSGQPLSDQLRQLISLAQQEPGSQRLSGRLAKSDSNLHLQCILSGIRDKQGNRLGIVAVLHDVSQIKQMTRELDYRARHDSLTGLLNRAEFEHCCDKALAGDSKHALLYLDLDQFKLVNDTCGHLAGDTLLTQLASILQQQVRPQDALARLGGDEFGVLLPDCTVEQARQIADKLRLSIKEFRFVWEDKLFELGCSIGLVPLCRHSGGYQSALARADLACYIAKDSGRNRVHLFTDTDQETCRREGEMSWAARLKRALEQDQFLLYRQPIVAVDPAKQRKQAHEVLLRLRDDNGAIIPPGAFLPAAERYHLISALDRRVIDMALSFYEQHPVELEQLGMCSINLSGQSISDAGFMEFIHQRLGQSIVPGHKICFEITETTAIANLKNTSEFIHRMRAEGVHFALDDFGSGMSSFGYLKQLPVNYLKIDGGFVKDIAIDPTDRALVEAINNIGHVMQMRTVAEFVECDESLRILQEIGVDFAQGYGIGVPEPLRAHQPEAELETV